MWMLITTIIIICTYFVYMDVRKPLNYPKGPKWLPLIGNYAQFVKKMQQHGYFHLVCEDLAKEYGSVTGLKMGKTLVVSVSGTEMVREVLTREEFMGRPSGFFFKMRTFGKQLGLVFSEGALWDKQRKFTISHLKSLGFGRQKMEAVIQDETADLVELLKKRCSKGPIEMKYMFDITVLNTLWALTAGKRFELNDERLQYLVELVHQAFTLVDASGGILNQMPILRFIAPNLTGFNTITKVINDVISFIRETIHEHNDSYDEDAPRDLIDMFIGKMREGEETFDEEQLISSCMDLFMAGLETTSNTLAFMMLYLTAYPDVQQKMQIELLEVVGTRNPTMKDKPRLPYINAVLCEIQRITNVAPAGVPHKTVCDTILADYFIPKGTVVLAHLYSVHMDPQFWKDPHIFNPDRFLNNEGKLTIPEKHFVPFGYGRRRCLGETLAKANLFTCITSLLQHFSFEKDPASPEIDLKGRDGFTLTPASANLVLKVR